MQDAFDPFEFADTLATLTDAATAGAGDAPAFDQLINFIQGASQRYPHSSRLRGLLGKALCLRESVLGGTEGDSSKAIEYYNEAIELDPFDPEHYEEMGFAKLLTDARDSIEMFRAALCCEPRIESFSGLIEALAERHEFAECEDVIARGESFLKRCSDRLEKAKQEVEFYKERGPDFVE